MYDRDLVREILYFEIDAEIIFEVCQNKIKPLHDTGKKILDNL